MKAAEQTSSHATASPKTSAPFFNKSGSDSFFGTETTAEPFFSPKTVQPKLTIGSPNDVYEQQADAVADQVMAKLSQPDSKLDTQNAKPTPSVQRQNIASEPEEKLQLKENELEKTEEKLQMKPIFESLAPPPPPSDEDTVQRKCADCDKEDKEKGPIQKKNDGDTEGSPSADLSSRLSSSKGGGSPLSDGVRSSMESAIGADFSGVRIHTGSESVQMNRELNAQAFAHGNDVYFGAGKYNPSSASGQHLLAHELVHTVQQNKMVNKQINRYMQDSYPWNGIINTSRAALRGEPNHSNLIANLPRGTSVRVIGHSGNWLQVEAFIVNIQQTGYISQELVAQNRAIDRSTFEYYPSVLPPSGRLGDSSPLGRPGIQSINVHNLPELGIASLRHFEIANLTGDILEQVKHDPAMITFERTLIGQIQNHPDYRSRSFYQTGVQIVPFGGIRWTSRTEDFFGISSDNPAFHRETWGVAFNELTWALRNATIRYWVEIDMSGRYSINYRLYDTLDLSPSVGRSEDYNEYSRAAGFVYHGLLGGNSNLQTRAQWSSGNQIHQRTSPNSAEHNRSNIVHAQTVSTIFPPLIKLWVNAFIPNTVGGSRRIRRGPFGGHSVFPSPPHPAHWNSCFETDDRGFSNRLGASSRVKVTADIDTLQHSVASTQASDLTFEVDCDTGVLKCSLMPSPSVSVWLLPAVATLGNRIILYVSFSANDPCVTGSPNLAFRGIVTIDKNARTFTLRGSDTFYPAFEMYADFGSGVTTIFRQSPIVDSPFALLVPGLSPLSESVSF